MFRKGFIAFLVFIFFSLIFFNKTFLKGEVPFPGDLLISQYIPYNSYSFLGYSPGSFPHKAQNIDVIEQLYPWKFLSIEMLKKGEFPLWNPYNFSGTPHLASIQSGTFYPVNILFFVMPFNLAWSFYIILQPILAGFFTYLFLREIKLSDKSSIFGGLIFSFSSFLVVWMQYGNIIHAVLWLPLVMWLGLKNLKEPSVFKSIALSFLLALSVFAGHFQVSIYLYSFSFIFLLFVAFKFYKKELVKNIGILLGVYFFSLLVSAIQIFPSVEIFINSSRTDYSYARLVEFLIPSYHLVSIIFPDFFGSPVSRNYYLVGTYIERVSYFGIIPLFFVIYALFSKKNAYFWFFIASIVTVFFITFDSFVTRFLYSIYIPPVIATSVPTRIMFVFIFSLCVVAAFGMDSFERVKKNAPLIKSLALTAFLVGSIWIFTYLAPSFLTNLSLENLSVSKRNLIVPSVVLFAGIILIATFTLRDKFLPKRYSAVLSKCFFALIFLLTIFELYFFFQKFSPFSPTEFIYPKNPALEFIKENQGNYRTWGYGSAGFEGNTQTYEGIYSTDGYDPFYIRRYGELMATTYEGGVLPDEVLRANAHLARGYGENDLRDNLFRQKIMDLVGVKYIFNKKEVDNNAFDPAFDESIYDLVWYGDNLQIYENKNVLPRAFLVTNYEVIEDDQKIIKRLYEKDFDIAESVILEKDPNIILSEKVSNNNLFISKYSENEIVIGVDVEDNSLLFLSDAYFPEWNAYVDGEKTEVFRANYAFRAVVVPGGEHKVVFRYEPKSFELGKIISISSIIGAVIIIAIDKIRRRNEAN